MTPSKGAILHEKDRPLIDRGNGARTTQMVTPACGTRSMLNGFTTIPPGGGIPLHYHDCEESVLIVSGHATVEIDGTLAQAQAGDVSWLPAGVPHRFLNPGTAPLRIFWTYASASATRTLVATGQTAPILAEQG